MAWDAVPWFVGGGAQHSPEVARLLAYAATNGAEGIVTPGDLKVTATLVPGGTVNIAPGDCLIRNRAQGGQSQTYVGRNPIEDNVPISPTGANTRSDLIIAQIEDPFLPGEPWQDPEDVTAGPYVFTRVIPNVPSWTKRVQEVAGFEGRTAITLARVDIPASTSTITDAMITDLRKVALPRQHRQLYASSIAVARDLTNTGSYAKWLTDEVAIEIPEWATTCMITGYIGSAVQMAGPVFAHVTPHFMGLTGFETAVDINTTSSASNGAVAPPITLKWETSDPNKKSALLANQGNTVQLQIWGKKNTVLSSDTGYLRAEAYGGTMLNIDVQFQEDPI